MSYIVGNVFDIEFEPEDINFKFEAFVLDKVRYGNGRGYNVTGYVVEIRKDITDYDELLKQVQLDPKLKDTFDINKAKEEVFKMIGSIITISHYALLRVSTLPPMLS